jgi:hypothetical protein
MSEPVDKTRSQKRSAAKFAIKVKKERRDKAADILESLLLDLVPEGLPVDCSDRKIGLHRMVDLLRAINPAPVRNGPHLSLKKPTWQSVRRRASGTDLWTQLTSVSTLTFLTPISTVVGRM